MLKETDMKIAEILEHFGYSNRTYFNKIFREKYNVSPREYRKMSREE
jgi:AraC-like DNA-binding protein